MENAPEKLKILCFNASKARQSVTISQKMTAYSITIAILAII